MGRMGRRQICNTFFLLYKMKIFLMAFFLEKKFFYMRVIWVAARTRTPIIGSLQKSRENQGSMYIIILCVLYCICTAILLQLQEGDFPLFAHDQLARYYNIKKIMLP